MLPWTCFCSQFLLRMDLAMESQFWKKQCGCLGSNDTWIDVKLEEVNGETISVELK